MAELHNTLMGRKLLEVIIPDIAINLDRIADALEHLAIRDKIEIELCQIQDENGDYFLDEEYMHQVLDEKIQKVKELRS
jgi:hypothetical protein